MKVLVIEDDQTTAEAIQLCLEIHRPDVTLKATASGLEGMRLFRSEPPDVVILDLGLDDIDGMDVLRMIRQLSDVPVLIVSARDELESLIMGKKLGADGYIVKPFGYSDFLSHLDKVTGRGKFG